MDWNWFFSSLSQSAAAIVGLLGGFVVSKILSNQARFESKKIMIEDLIGKCESLVDEGRYMDFDDYNERINNQAYVDLKDELGNTDKRDPEYFYNNLDFSLYENREKVLAEIKRLIDIYDRRNSPAINAMDMTDDQARYFLNRKHGVGDALFPIDDWPYRKNALIEYKSVGDSALHEYYFNVQKMASRVNERLSQIKSNPESSIFITLMLIAVFSLFFVCVVIPLYHLPFATESKVLLGVSEIKNYMAVARVDGRLVAMKEGFLVFLSIVFFLISFGFILLNCHLRYGEKVIRKISDFSDPACYSIYVALRVVNESKRNKYLFGS